MTGKLDLETLKRLIESGEIDTVVVAMTDMQGRLIGKRVAGRFFLDSVVEETHGCNYLLTADMEMEPVPGYDFANWELGYGDFHLVPDLATLQGNNAWRSGTDENTVGISAQPREWERVLRASRFLDPMLS